MLIKPMLAGALLFGLLGCAQLDDWTSISLKGEQAAQADGDPKSSAVLYVSQDLPADVADLTSVYIAPANLANMQVIQPDGAPADSEWWVTDEEAQILQRALAYEFSVALTYQSQFVTVADRSGAQLVVNTALVGVHPNETRRSVAEAGRPGGSLTVSIAVVNGSTGRVLARVVDTLASENIWSFNEVKRDDQVINEVFQALGRDVRRGLLTMQGRPEPEALQPAL
jgi:hypothetical protein